MPIAPAPGRAEDVAAADGDPGIVALAVRRDTAAVSSGTDGDYSNVIVDASGRMWVNVGALPASTNTLEVVGDVAQDAAIAGNPLSVGGRGSTAAPTSMSADGDSVFLWLDLKGSQVITGYAAQDAAIAGNPLQVGMRASTATPTAMSADGDVVFPWATREGAQVMVGPAADDAVLFGKPIQIGGRASTATPSAMSADGDIVTEWLDRSGATIVAGYVAQDAAVAGNPVLAGRRASTAIPTAMSTDGDSVHAWADLNGATVITPRPVATATLSNVSTSTTSATLIASNTSRKGVVIYNDAATTLYVKFGSTASATSFTYLLLTGETLELPGAGILYTGIITGTLASSTGTARVTELT